MSEAGTDELGWIERFKLDVDLRLIHIWQYRFAEPELDEGQLAFLLRAAYETGYQHAHKEETPGQLYMRNACTIRRGRADGTKPATAEPTASAEERAQGGEPSLD